MQREKLVVLLGREQRLVRAGELQAHDQRLDPADHEEDESGDEIADADRLVVDAREPADQAGLGLPDLVKRGA